MELDKIKALADQEDLVLIIDSLPNCLYQPMIKIHSWESPIREQGKTIKAFSLGDVYRKLPGIRFQQVFLRQRSAYDEMIGQGEREGDNQLLVPIDWQHIASISAVH